MQATQVVFDEAYYTRLMSAFGYDPLQFGKINFSLGTLDAQDLQRRWLCHHSADVFARKAAAGQKVVVCTGFGLSGVPHAGTLSQIIRGITLQQHGVPVSMVLGDLDAYNGKNRPLQHTLELADKFKEFALNLGFKPDNPSELRSQYSATPVLRTSYIIGKYMDQDLFDQAEEDLHSLYHANGKVDKGMTYRRSLSLNLMTADFLHKGLAEGSDGVLVMLGVDEHKYVRFGMEVLDRMKRDATAPAHFTMGGLYSPIIRGFNGYPKMSKSFPQSGLTVDMTADVIRERIMSGENNARQPEENVVYQMMASAGFFENEELRDCYEACILGDSSWTKCKEEYADMLVDICARWPK